MDVIVNLLERKYGKTKREKGFMKSTAGAPMFTKITRPTPLQRKAFRLLGLTL